MSTYLARIKNWGIKGGLSILDQGIFSGANFVLSILLARWLPAPHYGAFSIALAVYQFAYQAHNSLLLEPMSVLGPAKMHDRLAEYLRDQIKLHFYMSFVASLVTSVVGAVVFLFDRMAGIVLIILGIVLTFTLLPLLMRRIFYILQKPEFALVGSVIYMIVLVGVLSAIRTFGNVTIQLAFPIVAIAGSASGFFLGRKLPYRPSSSVSSLDMLADNWAYGKWLLYSSFLIALAAQAQTFIVGAFLGLSDAGAFRALQNFTQPMILLFTAVSAFLLPSLSYDFGRRNLVKVQRKGKYLLGLFLLIAIGFEVILLLYAPALEAFFYAGKFSLYAYLIPIWGLVPIVAALTYVYYYLLQSIQRPEAIMIGSLVWAFVSLISALILGLQWGIIGATVSVVLGYLFAGLVFAFLYRHHMRELISPRSTL